MLLTVNVSICLVLVARRQASSPGVDSPLLLPLLLQQLLQSLLTRRRERYRAGTQALEAFCRLRVGGW